MDHEGKPLPRTVLLADDSVTAQNMGRRILTDAGYEVITVNNGSAALKKIHENHPDLVILDVYMPGYGGLEVCQRLKESGETMRIPVLLSVGKMEPFKADEAKRVRADAHIVKPFEASELLAALAKLEDRIVPHADSWSRKSKKPSFWHDDEVPAAKPETSVAAAAQGTSEATNGSKVGAYPLVPEATGELPVLAEAASVRAEEAAPEVKAVANTAPEAREISSAQPSAANKDENLPAMLTPPLIAEEVAPPVEAPKSRQEFAASSAGRWIAENVALSPEEAAVELDQEMRAAESQEIRAASEGAANAVPAASLETSPSQNEGATFAAAAGASGANSPTSAVGIAGDESEPPTASEGTPAWQNWQQIRGAVMNSQNAAAIVETVAQAAKASAPVEPAVNATPATSQEAAPAAQSCDNASSSSDMEAGALASLVDSVLAELKPRLMEEIAKKMKK